MGKHEKTLAKLLSGTADVIATREGVRERITLQPDGSKAKGYQVRQVRNVLLNHPELLR